MYMPLGAITIKNRIPQIVEVLIRALDEIFPYPVLEGALAFLEVLNLLHP